MGILAGFALSRSRASHPIPGRDPQPRTRGAAETSRRVGTADSPPGSAGNTTGTPETPISWRSNWKRDSWIGFKALFQHRLGQDTRESWNKRFCRPEVAQAAILNPDLAVFLSPSSRPNGRRNIPAHLRFDLHALSAVFQSIPQALRYRLSSRSKHVFLR